MGYASIDDMFAGIVETRDVELPGGMVVKVRGMTRHELLISGQDDKGNEVKDPGLIERRWLSTGLVEPKMTEGEAAKWQKTVPMHVIQPALEAIQDLSGFGEGAQKSRVSRNGNKRA